MTDCHLVRPPSFDFISYISDLCLSPRCLKISFPIILLETRCIHSPYISRWRAKLWYFSPFPQFIFCALSKCSKVPRICFDTKLWGWTRTMFRSWILKGWVLRYSNLSNYLSRVLNGYRHNKISYNSNHSVPLFLCSSESHYILLFGILMIFYL